MILAEISLDTEFKIHDITKLLFHIHELYMTEYDVEGLGKDPLIKTSFVLNKPSNQHCLTP